MKIVIIALIVIVLFVIGFICYKMIQLKKLNAMSIDEIISYVTEKEDTYVSMAIIEDGEITYHTYHNSGAELENNTFDFEIGSISKTMAALLVSKAIDEEKISLSASISEYLDLPKDKYYPTIERIISHTAGYDGYYFTSEMIGNFFGGRNSFQGIEREKLLDKVGDLSLEDKDYSFKYSNFGISVIGLVLEAVYQKDYTELLNDYLQNELQLGHTSVASCTGNLKGYWNWEKGDGYIPAGAVISNIEDMAAYLNLLMTSEATEITRPFEVVKKVDGNSSVYTSMGIYLDEICMTWIHDTHNHILWHNGGTSNYNSYIAMNDDRTKGIVILANYGPDKLIPVTVIGARYMAGK